MKVHFPVELLPWGRTVDVEAGTALADVLFPLGVEFPCGGRGKCRGCRVKLLHGALDPTPEEQRLLSAAALAEGWRLSCRHQVHGPLKLELAQWETAILQDESPFHFVPQEGLGIAVDVGTTTLAAQLVDLETGNVLAVRTSLNPQARHGADIMSRVEYALAPEGAQTLTRLIREHLGGMVTDLLGEAGAPPERLRRIALVGNTVMHHLFGGLNLAPLAQFPFEPATDGTLVFNPSCLGWNLPDSVEVAFLPCLGGFVGSDILAGLLATGLPQQEKLSLLVDLGTNGEMVLGNTQGFVCASTAAGPAFEGARITCGMRAAAGAISAVTASRGALECHTLGGLPPRGICGSGLVDAVAAALDLKWIAPSGRLTCGTTLPLTPSLHLSQQDVRELQLAKGAIAAGIHLLLGQAGAELSSLHRIWLAGAFGNYISRASARRIGLLPFPPEKVIPAGNTALRGAKLALFDWKSVLAGYPTLRHLGRHVSLHECPGFADIYGEAMIFPAA
ncbi:ASKHA domain-containing protein [Fontisphaera persica]|uniref:ASKHA domain-containing protein n=1 Tax=Fontisphaera persica TaxID=2974023 RepID=UPI0024C047AB|nr:ASKHA domain-containing protein [Fontisphaera persica]WCJ59745.1 ASKHA domain-containing protein [Fontisphaera persica]